MKLKNKKTGEIREVKNILIDGMFSVSSLAKFNEEWEDAPEEPKGIQGVHYVNHFDATKMDGVLVDFETKEEAEKAVEKLKALKRLKDKGFRFVGWCDSVSDNNPDMALFKLNEDAWETDTCDDLDLLFSGGEE